LIDDDSDLKLASFVRFFKFGEFNRDFPTSLTTLGLLAFTARRGPMEVGETFPLQKNDGGLTPADSPFC